MSSDDIVARAEAALEDTYSALYDSPLVRELADEVKRLREACAVRSEAMRRDATEIGQLAAELDEARSFVSGHTADLTMHLMKRHEVEAERDQLRAAVERVRALAEPRPLRDQRYPASLSSAARAAVLAALDGPSCGAEGCTKVNGPAVTECWRCTPGDPT